MKKKNLEESIFGEDISKIDLKSFWDVVDKFNVTYRNPNRMSEVVKLLFNEDGSATDVTLKEAGNVLGISQSRVQQLRDKYFRILKNPYWLSLYTVEPKGNKSEKEK